MKILIPETVDDATLVSSNVPETLPLYSASTIYTAGQQIRDDASHHAYESLTGKNLGGVTISVTSPAVFMLPNHSLTNGGTALIATSGALPTGVYAETIYYVVNAAADTFELSETSGGASITATGSQSGTHSLYASPNKDCPLTDPSKWLDLGPTNRWAMFDRKLGTVTSNSNSIAVSLSIPARVTGMALFGLSAATIHVTMTDVSAGVVYDQTLNLVNQDNVGDYYDYFFAPILRSSEVYIEGIPPYSGAALAITISNPGGTAECGNLVTGSVRELGETVLGAGFGVIDYSRKEADDFGNVDLVERAYRNTGSFTVVVDRLLVDEVGRLLKQRRAQPTVFAGSGEFASMLIYGFARDWSVAVNNYPHSDLTIELESL